MSTSVPFTSATWYDSTSPFKGEAGRGMGRGWTFPATYLPHPYPCPPLEGEGVCAQPRMKTLAIARGDFLEVRLQLFQQRIVGRDPGGSVPVVAR